MKQGAHAMGTAWEPLGVRGAALRETLSAVVPLRMAELRDAHPDALIEWHRRAHRSEDQTVLLPYVDVLLYGNDREQLSSARRALVDGLAVAALVAEGGITFLDLHFCTNHHHCKEAAA